MGNRLVMFLTDFVRLWLLLRDSFLGLDKLSQSCPGNLLLILTSEPIPLSSVICKTSTLLGTTPATLLAYLIH